MVKSTLLRKILINISLILLNIIVFSDAFIGAGILWGFVVILFTVFVFLKVNFSGSFGNNKAGQGRNPGEPEAPDPRQCRAALRDYDAVIGQIDKFESKRDLIREAIGKSFANTELTYNKFSTAIDSVEAVFFDNIRALAEGVRVTADNGLVNKTVLNCSEINLKMDKLFLELTEYTAKSAGEHNKNSVLEELQNLIDSVKLYK